MHLELNACHVELSWAIRVFVVDVACLLHVWRSTDRAVLILFVDSTKNAFTFGPCVCGQWNESMLSSTAPANRPLDNKKPWVEATTEMPVTQTLHFAWIIIIVSPFLFAMDLLSIIDMCHYKAKFRSYPK